MIMPINVAMPSFKSVSKDSTLFYSKEQKNVITRTTKVLENPNQNGVSLSDKFELNNEHFIFEPADTNDAVNLYLVKDLIRKPIGTYDNNNLFTPDDVEDFIQKPPAKNTKNLLAYLYAPVTAALIAIGCGLLVKCCENKAIPSTKPLIENIAKTVKR